MIKKTQNVITAYYQRFKSYFREANIRSPISEKPHVWSPIIANFSNLCVLSLILIFSVSFQFYLMSLKRQH